ncbi:hypothetical protein KUV85_03360 [Nocardioides panacisoli]|uniref:hypothetical protein n=1 Tax=Nocardioides panacisoli TaxID=627624 RepID=UPI001C634E48|nr:hypothetical protein [Nocardioides panacisoli]QYJ04734.1 hypothetical protein KUV85_03360 [Nocardioides panacisoli]
MSVMGANSPARPDAAHAPRVRDMAREAVLRMAFSATVSLALAALLLVLAYGIGR